VKTNTAQRFHRHSAAPQADAFPSLGFLLALALLALLAILAYAPAARAAEAAPAEKLPARRFALVVGANDGGPSRVRLRYAGADAQAVARVLQQLGGVAPADLTLLLEPGRAQLEAALRSMSPRLQGARAASGRVELVVYYSGHSDEEALLPRGERYGYPELRAALDGLPADVRVTILDSCASGALTRQKGGTSRPPFLLDAASTVKGQAILTSASADEAAQESDRIGGSYFTQALLTGLRGAADTQRSGRVTLGDAYQYAFADTLARTERTQAGPQHPAYEMQLAGSGDLVMTDLRGTAAGLVLPASLKGRVMVRDASERLVVELKKPAGRVIDLGLEAGEVRVTVDDNGALGEARLQLADGKRTELDAKALTPVSREAAVARGDLPSASAAFTPQTGEEQADGAATTVSVGLVPGGSDRTDNGFAINLGIGRYRNLHGLDVGLGGSIYLGDVHGLQANVGISWADGNAGGVQTAAGITFAGGDVKGLQASSGVAVTRGLVKGLQGSTMFSWAGSITGLQSSSGVAMTNGEVYGVQAAAVASIGGGEVHGLQAAGVVNYAGELHGVQASVVNLAGGAANGVQLGVVNVSDDTPVAIGLVSWVRRGHHHVSLLGTELGPKLEGKLGGTTVYTVYSAGLLVGLGEAAGAPQRYRFGLGLGAHFDLGERAFLEVEGVADAIYQSGSWSGNDVLATARLAFGYRIAGDLAIVAGPSWNTFVSWNDKLRDIGYGAVYVTKDGGRSVRNWPGGSVGLQF
jgi:hypothetical protein